MLFSESLFKSSFENDIPIYLLNNLYFNNKFKIELKITLLDI